MATTTAFTAFDDTIADNITLQNARAARKQAKNDFRETLPLAVRNIVKWVEAAFGEGSKEVRAVIGDGTTVLSNAPDDKVEDYLESVIDVLTPLIGNGVDARGWWMPTRCWRSGTRSMRGQRAIHRGQAPERGGTPGDEGGSGGGAVPNAARGGDDVSGQSGRAGQFLHSQPGGGSAALGRRWRR